MRVWWLAVLLAVGGCVMSHGPRGDLGFRASGALREFEGCYRNIADGGDRRVGPFLSFLIWTKPPVHPAEVDAVQVTAVGEQTLVVSAYAGKQVVWESLYRGGEDFEFVEGVLKRSEMLGSAPTAAGNVFLGVGHEAARFGLDPAGNARVELSTSMAGTAFLVIPIAGHSTDAYRFPRASELCGGK